MAIPIKIMIVFFLFFFFNIIIIRSFYFVNGQHAGDKLIYNFRLLDDETRFDAEIKTCVMEDQMILLGDPVTNCLPSWNENRSKIGLACKNAVGNCFGTRFSVIK